jgi:deazaflavin-dependent oxidoreductase (nitroreductase family)
MKAETFFYLVTRGRHSGLPRRLEIWFVELAGAFYLLAESHERTDWIENIRANPEVTFSIGNRKNANSEVAQAIGRGRLLDDDDEAELCARVRASLYAKYRWRDGKIVEIAPQPAAT